MFVQGDVGPPGPHGPIGETGHGLPGPKVTFKFVSVLCILNRMHISSQPCFINQGERGYPGLPGPFGPKGEGLPGPTVRFLISTFIISMISV